MLLSEFDYELPEKLIAQYPLPNRTASRLLKLNSNKELSHHHFVELLDWLNPGDMMVFNNTKVIPARLFGQKATGGKIEVLIERLLEGNRALAHVKASKSPKAGKRLQFDQAISATVISRQNDLFILEFNSEVPLNQILEQQGQLPLPPYIDRQSSNFDAERYQTVYAKFDGAVAAPTAGLHFDDQLLQKIQEKNVGVEFVTLHVGAGTFQPVRVENIQDHQIHSEYFEINQTVADKINAVKAKGGRIIAVGTTSMRALESATQDGKITSHAGDTQLFIYPGFKFQTVDVLITNFHLPKTSLLMLVSAFGGYDAILNAYQSAIENNYRFYSYGDAMWIES